MYTKLEKSAPVDEPLSVTVPEETLSLPMNNNDILNHIQSFVTELIHHGTISTPTVPLSPGPINLQNEIYQLREAVKQHVQQQQDFMKAIFRSIIHRDNSLLSFPDSANKNESETISNMTFFGTPNSPMDNTEEISLEERRAMSWAVRNMLSNSTDIESSIEQVSSGSGNSIIITKSANLIKPLFNDSPSATYPFQSSYTTNEHLDNNDIDYPDLSPRKQRRTDPETSTFPAVGIHDKQEMSLLIRVIAQLEEERVQLLSRLSELEEYIIPERDDLINELKVSLLQSIESNQEYSSMASIFNQLVDHVQDIENTNTELVILAKCTEINKSIIQDDNKNNDMVVDVLSTEETKLPMMIDSHRSSPFHERVQNNVRKKRRTRTVTDNENTSLPILMTTVPLTTEESILPPSTDPMFSTSLLPASANTTETVTTDNTSSSTDKLLKRITFLEEELETSTFTRELLYDQLKELREKARANQLKLINDHTEEITLLKQVHAKTIARILSEKIATTVPPVTLVSTTTESNEKRKRMRLCKDEIISHSTIQSKERNL